MPKRLVVANCSECPHLAKSEAGYRYDDQPVVLAGVRHSGRIRHVRAWRCRSSDRRLIAELDLGAAAPDGIPLWCPLPDEAP